MRFKRSLLPLLLTMAAAAVLAVYVTPPVQQAAVLPVWTEQPAAADPIIEYRARRDRETQRTLSALETLLQSPETDADLHHDAAELILTLSRRREAELALEGALLESGLAGCVAVIGDGCVTIICQQTPTTTDLARLTELALVHAGIPAEGIRVITASQ